MLRAIRIAALAAIAVVLLLPPAGSAGRNSGVKRVSSLDSALAVQVNAFRVAHGLVPLRVSPFLAAAARAHSTQMARLGYFSHNSANGSSFSSRIATYYPAREPPGPARGGDRPRGGAAHPRPRLLREQPDHHRPRGLRPENPLGTAA